MDKLKKFIKSIPKEKLLSFAIGVVFLSIVYMGIYYAETYVYPELAKPIHIELKQQIAGIKLIGTNQPLADSLKEAYKGESAWLYKDYEVKLSKDEIVNYYEKELTKNGWQSFKHREVFGYSTGNKMGDSYDSQKEGVKFILYFIASTDFTYIGKTKYSIYVRFLKNDEF